MNATDPDWWTPHTDDYTATYGETPVSAGPDDAEPDEDPTIGEEYAEFDAGVRFAIERGRPGYTHPDED